MNSNSANDRFTVLASRVLTVLENANIQDDEFVSLKIVITDKDGGLVKSGSISELDDKTRRQ